MFRIMLCCSAGMSTSLLVRKMVEEAEQRNLPVEIDAYGVAEFDVQFPRYQVVLLGPQVKYMLNTLSEKAAAVGCKIVLPVDLTVSGEFKAGAFRIACKAGAPVVPVAIDGSYKIMEANHNLMKPAHVNITILPPVETAGLGRTAQHELAAQVAQSRP